MKKISFAVFLLFSALFVKAQYVLIPDSNFRTALISKGYGSCFDSTFTMLDTTCSNVLDSTSLIMENDSIASIEGVQYFKRLLKLDCIANRLTALPRLPITLSQLYVDDNYLTMLPELPPLLTNLEVSNNSIGALPNLPNSLEILFISHNNFTTLPQLPSGLLVLFCYGNFIDSFPALPPHLNTLECGEQEIHFFSSLPDSLEHFSCPNANLDSLPLLKSSLRSLDCSLNQLTFLPPIPTSLTSLNCSYNQLTQLPDLPDSLNSLMCGYNRQLRCLPYLKKIVTFNFDSTAITCLPDYGNVTNSSPSLSSFPLCISGNANGCATYTDIKTIADDVNVSVYPNPTSNQLEIELQKVPAGNLQISMLDISGQVLRSENISVIDKIEMDVSELPAGLYFLRLQVGGERWVRKFIKE